MPIAPRPTSNRHRRPWRHSCWARSTSTGPWPCNSGWCGRRHDRGDGQITLLLCEHPPIITVGRGGSPGDVAMQSGPVRNRQIEVRWVNRGGGCLVHCPGQLAIYPIVPLRWHGFSVGEFLDRFQAGIVETLDELNVPSTRPSASGRKRGQCPFVATNLRSVPALRVLRQMERSPFPPGVWGRTGQLAALGVAVRHWITYYGAYLNVCPPMGLFRLVESDPRRPDQDEFPGGRTLRTG